MDVLEVCMYLSMKNTDTAEGAEGDHHDGGTKWQHKVGFHRRIIQVDAACVRCGSLEIPSHILFDCTFAQAVWFGSNIGCNFFTSTISSIAEWISTWGQFAHLGKKEARSKNDAIFGRRTWKPEDVIAAASSSCKEFIGSLPTAQVVSAAHFDHHLQWQRPDPGFIKCNCDASLPLSDSFGGLGYVWRNSAGDPIKAVSLPYSFNDILVGEALVVRQSLVDLHAFGHMRVVIESDNSNLIRFLTDSTHASPLLIRPIVDDILHLSFLFSFLINMLRCLRVYNKGKGSEKEKKESETGKEEFFLKNGALLLEQLVTSCDGKSNPIRVFSAIDLQIATNNYDLNLIIREDGSYKSYKGTHEEQMISVKRFEGQGKRYWLGESIREVVIASQLNHSNVLKLLGCCLETKVPILVYEFASNGVLFDQIHGKKDDSSTTTYMLLSWETRLKIANEIANAVTYVQMATSELIVHRDVRPSNVFLDHKWVSKLSDFTSSISIPSGETHVEVDSVRGAPGFIDPESIRLSHLTEKSDVYSFGMLLLELLTGHRAYSIHRENSGLKAFLHDHERPFVEDNRVIEVLTPSILQGGMINQQQLQASMELALRCTREKAEERPAMIEVAKELKQIQRTSSDYCQL
ncbi:serine/threonine-protein kinase ZRK1-like [Telopea speciosissima]|uniref:serine/threonine-protein kinase ZRK1-like n=1 Tax=Telopea speciosissima TaxID=54955 RepID=UPI001CC6D15F|nr:serine/threonine-protein kinase ZRK1-like [Telopea speciosissima]